MIYITERDCWCEGKKDTCLVPYFKYKSREQPTVLLPFLRIHSSWKMSLPGALSGIPYQEAFLLRAIWTHNCLLRVAEGKPRKLEGKWLLRPSEGACGKTSTRIELDIWDTRPVFYLLIAVLMSQGVPGQWHLPVYKRKLKKREMAWRRFAFASNPQPLRNNTFPLRSCNCSLCAPPFFFFFIMLLPWSRSVVSLGIQQISLEL